MTQNEPELAVAEQDINWDEYVAAIPLCMEDYDEFNFTRLSRSALAIYGREHRHTFQKMGTSQIGAIVGGVAGRLLAPNSIPGLKTDKFKQDVERLADFLRGMSNHEIAEKSGLGVPTVSLYRSRLYGPMGEVALPLPKLISAAGWQLEFEEAEQRPLAVREQLPEPEPFVPLTVAGMVLLQKETDDFRVGEGWGRKARCIDPTVAQFDTPEQEKTTCEPCPVKADCLVDALTDDTPGKRKLVLGGLTFSERNNFTRKLNRIGAKQLPKAVT